MSGIAPFIAAKHPLQVQQAVYIIAVDNDTKEVKLYFDETGKPFEASQFNHSLAFTDPSRLQEAYNSAVSWRKAETEKIYKKEAARPGCDNLVVCVINVQHVAKLHISERDLFPQGLTPRPTQIIIDVDATETIITESKPEEEDEGRNNKDTVTEEQRVEESAK